MNHLNKRVLLSLVIYFPQLLPNRDVGGGHSRKTSETVIHPLRYHSLGFFLRCEQCRRLLMSPRVPIATVLLTAPSFPEDRLSKAVSSLLPRGRLGAEVKSSLEACGCILGNQRDRVGRMKSSPRFDDVFSAKVRSLVSDVRGGALKTVVPSITRSVL